MSLQDFDAVFKKWENRPAGRRSAETSGASGGASKAWRDKYGANLPRPDRRPTRARNKRRPKDAISDFPVQLFQERTFQVIPPAIPAMFKSRRPLMGRACERCCTESRNLYDEKSLGRGLYNILNISSYTNDNLFRRSFSHILFVAQRDVSHRYPSVKKAVLKSERVKNSIMNFTFQDTAGPTVKLSEAEIEDIDAQRQKQILFQEKQAMHIISHMATTIYGKLIRLTGWFLLKLFGKLFHSIQIHHGQKQMLEEAVAENKPLVFLPLHKSHMDYLIITLILFTCDIKAPHVAAGDNLRNMPIFSWLLHHLGGFFIKRKMDHMSGKDELYKCILQEYMEQLLKRGQYLEVYIEGSRSRTGKAMVPKSGMLSVIVSAVLEGVVPDVYIVPVNISYEKVVEENYSQELLGETKKPESFWGTIKGIWRVLRTEYGYVRVDFAQPFSLQEFVQSMGQSLIMQDFASNMVVKASQSSPLSSMVRNSSDLSLSDIGDDKCFTLTKALGYHVIYDAVQCCAIMSTNMVSFLLLTKHRKGVTLDELVGSFEWLKEEILDHGRDVGFTGKSRAVVCHALHLLEEKVIITSKEGPTEGAPSVLFVQPKLTIPDVLDLVISSNVVNSVFALEAVVGPVYMEKSRPGYWGHPASRDNFATRFMFVEDWNELKMQHKGENKQNRMLCLAGVVPAACSIITLVGESDLMYGKGMEQEAIISQTELIEKAKELCEVLQKEFIFAPPCITLDDEIEDTLDVFTACEILKTAELSGCSTREKQLARSLEMSTAWDDPDEGDGEFLVQEVEYKLGSSPEQLAKIRFLQSVLLPLMESYYVAARGLLWLLNQNFTEDEFLKTLQDCAKERVRENVTLYAESCSLEPLRNAVRVFKEWQVLEITPIEGKSIIHLTERFNTEEAVLEVFHRINQFRV